MNDPPTGFEPLSASAAARPRPGELRTGTPPHGNAALAALQRLSSDLGKDGTREEQMGYGGGRAGLPHSLLFLFVGSRREGATMLSRCGQAGQRMRAVIPSFDLI